jgi:hypothetical protein
MILVLGVLLAQASSPPRPPDRGHFGVPPNVRCVADSFGNYTCSDGSRILLDSRGGFTVIPGRR